MERGRRTRGRDIRNVQCYGKFAYWLQVASSAGMRYLCWSRVSLRIDLWFCPLVEVILVVVLIGELA